MKAWIMTVFRVQPLLEQAVELLEERMSQVALQYKADVQAQAQAILDLTDRKRRLINLAVLGHRLECGLREEQIAYIKAAARGKTCGDLAAEYGVSRTTAHRRTQIALKSAQGILHKLGFDAERFDAEYADIPFVRKVYIACGQASKRSAEVTRPVVVPTLREAVYAY